MLDLMIIHFEPDQGGEEIFRIYYPEDISSASLSHVCLMYVIKTISSVALAQVSLINPVPRIKSKEDLDRTGFRKRRICLFP